jgi:dolichyl-diphosphooligosaccharide--protein glycosyltransferase
VNPEPWVLDWEGAEQRIGTGDTVVSPSSDGETVKRFESLDAARQYVENDTTAQVGGFGPYPSQRVPALEQYRLVHTSQFSGLQGGLSQAFSRDSQVPGLLNSLNLPENASQQQITNAALNTLYRTTPSWVKTFERVPGATIEGSGPANATLRLSARMEPENAAPFTYTQQVQTDADGEFATTVPYSTTGYDELGPEEGYTNPAVRANGSYQITSAPVQEGAQIVRYSDTVNVTEAQVVGEDDTAVAATLDSQVLGNLTQSPSNGGESTSGDGSTDDGTSDTANSVRDGVVTDTAPRVASP